MTECLDAGGDPPTFEDVVAVLAAQSGVFDDLELTLDATGKRVGDTLQIDLTLHAARTTEDVALNLGDEINELLLVEDLTGVLTTTASWDFQVEVDLATMSIGDAFSGYFASPLTVTADLALPNLVTDARAGFLGLSIGTHGGHQSTITLDADLNIALADPGGEPAGAVTLAELSDSGTSLATQSGTAQIDIGLYGISGLLGVADDPTNPAYIQSSDDLLDEIEGVFLHNFEESGVRDFSNIDATQMRQLLRDFSESFLAGLSGSAEIFGDPVPLAHNLTFADAIDLRKIFDDQITAELSTEENEEGRTWPSFDSFQKLVEVVGSPIIADCSYDVASKQLQFSFKVVGGLPPLTTKINLPALGALTRPTSESEVEITPTASLDMSIAMVLSPLGSNLATLSRDTLLKDLNRGTGIRTREDADVEVALSDGTKFQVDLSHDPETATVGTIINAFVTAASAHGVSERFKVEIDAENKRLLFSYRPGPGENQPFSISAVEDSGARLDLKLPLQEFSLEEGATEIVIEGLPLHGDTLQDHFFVTDAQIKTDFELQADALVGSGQWGSLSVAFDDGTATATISLEKSLTDPGPEVGDVGGSLRELSTALASDPTKLVSSSELSGPLEITLLLCPDPVFTDGSSETAEVTISGDISNDTPDSETVQNNTLGRLLRAAERISVADVTAQLDEFVNYLEGIENRDPFSQRLPGLFKRIRDSELIDISSRYEDALSPLGSPTTLQQLESSLNLLQGFSGRNSAFWSVRQATGCVWTCNTCHKTLRRRFPWHST